MLYRTKHVTLYRYEEAVSQCLSEARLKPRSFPGQRVEHSEIVVSPEPAVFEERRDYFGNGVSTFAILRRHDRFETTATSVVEVAPRVLDPRQGDVGWEDVRDLLAAQPDPESLEAFEFVFESPFVGPHAELVEFAKDTFTPGRGLLDAAHELSHRIHREFCYVPKSTRIDMPLLKSFHNKAGVCQDFAHVMIGVLRSFRLAARYVSGYLRSGTKYTGAEASHAWVAVFLPDRGWVHFDPTNDLVVSDGHVTLAWGRDYGDVTPMKGIALGGGPQVVEVEVRVEPIGTGEGA